jgi:two-component system chemotaxis response regulator CheB
MFPEPRQMPMHDIVVMGGSAGALQPLIAIVERMPPDLSACVLIVMHMRAESDSLLPGILERVSALPVSPAMDGAPVKPGHIYVARPDLHLLATSAGVRVSHGPRENGFRPAVDPLFRTAARDFGPRVVGVVLSGALGDGTYGLNVIKQHGGIAIVQDPADAIIDNMPRNAITAVEVDYVLPAAEIAAAIERLSHLPVRKGDHAMARKDDLEPQLLSEETEVASMQERFGAPSALTCPDCGGALWEVHDGRLVRYQCHVGHQYAPDALDTEHRDAVDGALWTAVRILEEQADLKTRLSQRAEANGLPAVADGFSDGAREAHAQAQQIRAVLFGATTRAQTSRRAAPPRKTRKTRKPRRKG